MLRSKFFIAAALAATALFVAPATSRAGFQVQIEESGYTSATVTDNGTGDTNSNTGTIGLDQSFGNFTDSLVAAASNSTSNTAPATLDLTSLDIKNTDTAAHTLTLIITDTGYTVPTGSDLLSSSIGATKLTGSNDSVSVLGAVNSSNGSTYSVTSVATNQGVDGPFTTSNPFTITMTVTITLAGGGEYTGSADESVSASPAPSGLVMLASAVPFAGLLRLRRRLAPVAATV